MLQRVPLSTEPLYQLQQKYMVQSLAIEEMEVFDNLFRLDPSCQASFSTVFNFIGGGGVRVTKKNRPQFQLTPQFQQEMDAHWMVFARDCIRCLWCYGFVIVDSNTEDLPYVLDPLLHQISIVRGDRGFLRVHLTSTLRRNAMERQTPLTTPFFLVDNALHHSGQIKSKVDSLRPFSQLQNLLLGCTARAAQRRSMPALVLEHNPLNPQQREIARDVAQIGDHADLIFNNTQQVDELDMIQARENEERTRRLNAEMEAAFNRPLPFDPVTGAPRYPADGGEDYFHSRIVVESGKHVVAGPLAEGPADVVEMMSITEADAAKTFGVPPALWGSQRSAVAVDQMVMVVFNATVQLIKQQLTHIFELMLDYIHGEGNHAHTRGNLDPNRSVTENIEDHSFRVSFPGLQDAESIQSFLENGAMKWSMLTKYWAAATGVPVEDFAKEQVEVATGRPLREAVEAEREMQEKQLDNEIKAAEAQVKTANAATIKNLSQAASAKRKSTSSSSKGPTTRKKSQKTTASRVKNARTPAAKSKKKANV